MISLLTDSDFSNVLRSLPASVLLHIAAQCLDANGFALSTSAYMSHSSHLTQNQLGYQYPTSNMTSATSFTSPHMNYGQSSVYVSQLPMPQPTISNNLIYYSSQPNTSSFEASNSNAPFRNYSYSAPDIPFERTFPTASVFHGGNHEATSASRVSHSFFSPLIEVPTPQVPASIDLQEDAAPFGQSTGSQNKGSAVALQYAEFAAHEPSVSGLEQTYFSPLTELHPVSLEQDSRDESGESGTYHPSFASHDSLPTQEVEMHEPSQLEAGSSPQESSQSGVQFIVQDSAESELEIFRPDAAGQDTHSEAGVPSRSSKSESEAHSVPTADERRAENAAGVISVDAVSDFNDSGPSLGSIQQGVQTGEACTCQKCPGKRWTLRSNGRYLGGAQEMEVVLEEPTEGAECPITLSPVEASELDFMPGVQFVEGHPAMRQMRLGCGHAFSAMPLIFAWLVGHMRCPLCRSGVGGRLDAESLPTHLRAPIKNRLRELGHGSDDSENMVLMVALLRRIVGGFEGREGGSSRETMVVVLSPPRGVGGDEGAVLLLVYSAEGEVDLDAIPPLPTELASRV
mmetsp:Transcript_80667/g.216190  ORF Transcript_80667/g.216190 Transcript_80667/m.216190 type:complete len:570 (+) Transcript_80667:350-2059(+)